MIPWPQPEFPRVDKENASRMIGRKGEQITQQTTRIAVQEVAIVSLLGHASAAWQGHGVAIGFEQIGLVRRRLVEEAQGGGHAYSAIVLAPVLVDAEQGMVGVDGEGAGRDELPMGADGGVEFLTRLV